MPSDKLTPERRLIVGHPFLRCSMPAICATPLLCHECDQPEQDHRESAPEPAPRQAVSQSADGLGASHATFDLPGVRLKAQGVEVAAPEVSEPRCETCHHEVSNHYDAVYCLVDGCVCPPPEAKPEAAGDAAEKLAEEYTTAAEGQDGTRAELTAKIRVLVEQATREAVIATQEDPEGEVALGVFAERQIRRGCSYDAKAGIWWKDDEKPGMLQELEAALAAERKAREEIQETLERWFQLGERVLKAAGNVWADTPLKAMDRIEARIRELEKREKDLADALKGCVGWMDTAPTLKDIANADWRRQLERARAVLGWEPTDAKPSRLA